MSQKFFVQLNFMPPRGAFSALMLFVVSLLCSAQTGSKSTTPDPFRNEAIIFEQLDTAYLMHADASGERDLHVRVRIQSDGAAQQFGVLSFAYASATETPVIKFARVKKPDGSTVETPVSDAIDMPAQVTSAAPLYSDLKEKHLPIRSLSRGDTLEYEVDTRIDKAETPDQFWGAYHFTPPGTIVVLAETLTLKLPSEKYAQVWSPNHKPAITDQAGVRTYVWSGSQLITEPKAAEGDSNKPSRPRDPDEDGDGRKLPSVAWTTFHSWPEVGDWYRQMAMARAEPNDRIRAEAESLTRNAKTAEEQVRALYEFVSTHTRYVGIDFGIGRYQPHTAEEVLANQYGDCKDKDTLLEAMLRAKGFSTAPALVGAGITPVPDVPSPSVFNHVITTVQLPGGRVWLDSTAQGAPYQYLSAPIRDQKALLVPSAGASALESTPAAAPYPFTAHFEATASVDAEGKLTGKITSSYHDDDEVLVRALARNMAPADWDKASQYISSVTGFGGTTSDTRFTNAEDDSLPITVNYTYTRHPFGDWDNHRIVPLFPAAELPALESDTTAPEEDIQLGALRTLTAASHIRLPEGFRTDLPDPVHVKTDFATFDKTYRFDGHEILAERTIVVLKSKLPKEDWKLYQSFRKNAGLEGETWIQLIPSSPSRPVIANLKSPATSTPASTGGKDSETVASTDPMESSNRPSANAALADTSSAEDWMKTANDRFRSGDLGGEKEALDRVKAKNPEQEYLWSMYAFIAMRDRNFVEEKADLLKELSFHPDNEVALRMLAARELQDGDSVEARRIVQDFLAHHPDNLEMTLFLAVLETNAEDYAAALKTLETAADQNPDNKKVRLLESAALHRLNRNEEAAAAARSVLTGTEDPELLNDGAYRLSETGIDLPLAEQASRKSIAMLEDASAGISTAEVNSRAFVQANLLIHSWDTLGWILYREGKMEEAKPLISAAWRASLTAETGAHLAQVYQAMGQNDQAAAAYALAQAALTRNPLPEVRHQITEGIAQLRSAGAKSARADRQSLQDLRTFKISRPGDVSGWGTFRLEITTAGVIESQQMSGDKQIAEIKKAVDQMKFPELIPPDSKAHLLRSAVVSCATGTSCELVLVPDGGLQTEQE
jgi:tetratricopeptide (TPR) repeat protein